MKLTILLTTLLCSLAFARDIIFIQDGEEADVEKQIAEGNVVLEEDLTKVKTELSDVETEVLDNSIFGGADIVQRYDIHDDYEEDVTLTVDEGDQIVSIEGNDTKTDIHIDVNRQGENRESVDVNFEVEHEGETYLVEYDTDTEVEVEKYRVDEQELNVYVEENIGENFVVMNDDIEVEILVDIDDIDLDWRDWLSFDIGLYGEKDAEINDDIFISGRYENKAEERQQEEGQQLDELITTFNCSVPLEFAIPEYTVARRGQRFEQFCSISTGYTANILSATWKKVNPRSGQLEEVSSSAELIFRSPSCQDAAVYKCEVQYLCDGEEKSALSSSMTVLVDNEVILNPICHIFGDPHIITFDRKLYSFQGECTYLLAMDATYGRWLIYGRFTTCGQGSCLESVVVYAQGYALELQRGWVINQNGEKLPIKEGRTISPDKALSVYFDGYEVYMELKRSQIQLTWDGLMNLKIEAATAGATTGLCGNNNGDADDDFMTFYGDLLQDSNEFGHQAAVDRRGSCQKPVTLETVGDTSEARRVCEEVLLSGIFAYTSNYLEQQALKRADPQALVRAEQFMDACVFDYMADMHVETLSPQCYAGYNYFSIAKRLGVCMPEGWQDSVGCLTKEELQDLTVTQGCPYGDTEFPFIRNSV